MRLDGKVAIVTGAAGGIGLATAIRLGRQGAAVMLAQRRLDGQDAHVAAVVQAGAPDARAVACDVSDEAAVAACCAESMRHFGRIDIICRVPWRRGCCGRTPISRPAPRHFDPAMWDVRRTLPQRSRFLRRMMQVS